MKLKKLAALCKEHKRAIIYQKWKYPQAGGVKYLAKQFISDGTAVFAAHGLPPLDKESLLRIFDIAEEDFKKWHVSVYSTDILPVDLSDSTDQEQQVRRFFWPIVRNGDNVRVLGTEENGVLFIRENLLGPVSDITAPEYYERRTKSGASYIVIKEGLFLRAAILPLPVLTESVLQEYGELLFRMRKEMLNRDLPRIVIDQEDFADAETESREGEQMEL